MKGKTLPVKKCKVCKGEKAGEPLKRSSDGLVTLHTSGNLKRHLLLHNVVFGAPPPPKEQKQKGPVKNEDPSQSTMLHFARFTKQQQEELTQAIVLM